MGSLSSPSYSDICFITNIFLVWSLNKIDNFLKIQGKKIEKEWKKKGVSRIPSSQDASGMSLVCGSRYEFVDKCLLKSVMSIEGKLLFSAPWPIVVSVIVAIY